MRLEIRTERLDEAEEQFKIVLESIEALKENAFISFTGDESQLIETFKKMIQEKQQQYRNEGLLSKRRETLSTGSKRPSIPRTVK